VDEEDPSESTAPPADAADPAVEQLTLYDILPFAPETDPVRQRRRWPLPLIGTAVLAVAALSAVVTIWGGRGPVPGAASRTSEVPTTLSDGSPTTSPPTTVAPATSDSAATTTTTEPAPAAEDELAAIGVRPGDLGGLWSDLGLARPSASVTTPPPTCAQYDGVFSLATVHKYSYNPPGSPQDGVLSSAVVDTGSMAATATDVAAARRPSFATCAGATAEQELGHNVVDQPVVNSMSAQPLGLVTVPDVVGWRTIVDFAGTAGSGSFGMDIFYAWSGTRLARVAVSRCFCASPVIGTGSSLLPDEVLAVNAVAHRMAESQAAVASLLVNAVASGSSIGPCSLIDATEMGAVLSAAPAGVSGTVVDGANECVWQQPSAGVVVQTGDTVAQFEARVNNVSQPLGGIGDQAFVDPGGAGKVLARKGQIWIQVFVAGTAADRPTAINLAQSVLAAL
jgi:hypothetical protein